MNRFRNFQQAIAEIDNFKSLCDYFEEHIGAYGFYAFTFGSAPLSKGKVDSSGAVLFRAVRKISA
ncbi:MAG: hypothetical protein GXP24_08090 [Planctomycetes bacterium]|nr:hypothetical protein [Planctomycetota bacterium]